MNHLWYESSMIWSFHYMQHPWYGRLYSSHARSFLLSWKVHKNISHCPCPLLILERLSIGGIDMRSILLFIRQVKIRITRLSDFERELIHIVAILSFTFLLYSSQRSNRNAPWRPIRKALWDTLPSIVFLMTGDDSMETDNRSIWKGAEVLENLAARKIRMTAPQKTSLSLIIQSQAESPSGGCELRNFHFRFSEKYWQNYRDPDATGSR